MVCEHFYSHFQWITQFMCIFILMFVFTVYVHCVCMHGFYRVFPKNFLPHSLLSFGNTLSFYYRQNLAHRQKASKQAKAYVELMFCFTCFLCFRFSCFDSTVYGPMHSVWWALSTVRWWFRSFHNVIALFLSASLINNTNFELIRVKCADLRL